MTNPQAATPTLSNRFYDQLKFLAIVLLPGLGALYFGLGQIWGFPKIEEVVGSITVVDTFLGLLLRALTTKYYRDEKNFDGEAIVSHEDGGKKVTLAGNAMLEDLVDDPGKHSLEFKIERQGTAPE